MSYYKDDAYNQPEAFGLRIIGQLFDPEAFYSFHDLVVWVHEDGRVFYASDLGCSCPSPFEDYTSLDSLTEVTNENWAQFQADVQSHCAPDFGPDPQAVDKVDILRKVALLL